MTTFTKGQDGVTRAQVFFREGGNPLAMREEAVHISQLAEGGDTAKKIGLLTEENLAKWPKMSTGQRLDIYKAKIEVEIDAQQRLLKQFGEGDPQYVRSVQHNLENLKARMAEVDLGVKNPKAVEDADWLQEAQAPRLFSKPVSPGKITGDGNVIRRRFQIASDPNNPEHLSAQAELRVAKLLKSEGENVHFIDNEINRGLKGPGISNDFTLLNSSTQVDVKRLSGIGRNAAKDISKGVRQVGSNGQVIIVRPSNSANTIEQYNEFIKGFKPSDPSVKIRLIDESELPEFQERY